MCVTAINPVGKGRTSFVNMSLQCDDLSELIKKFFYRFLPIMRSSEMHAFNYCWYTFVVHYCIIV